MTDDVLARLAAMPGLLRRIAEALPEAHMRQPGLDGSFSFVEHAWHLADLEREGYGTRITRLLTEDHPALPDFNGERAAREREYRHANPALAVQVFTQARQRNLDRLRALDPAARARAGVQEGVGDITLEHLPRMMAEHDRGHAQELLALLSALGAPAPVLDVLRAHAAPPPLGPGASRSRAA